MVWVFGQIKEYREGSRNFCDCIRDSQVAVGHVAIMAPREEYWNGAK